MISNYLYWISIDFFDFSDFFLISIDFFDFSVYWISIDFSDFFLISIDFFDFSVLDFYWFLYFSDFFLISLISSWFLWFLWFLLDFFDFFDFFLISLISVISLDFSWFLLISKNMYVISHSDLPLEQTTCYVLFFMKNIESGRVSNYLTKFQNPSFLCVSSKLPLKNNKNNKTQVSISFNINTLDIGEANYKRTRGGGGGPSKSNRTEFILVRRRDPIFQRTKIEYQPTATEQKNQSKDSKRSDF